MHGDAAILFTAFEPSGDDHASVVIAELKRRYPALPIFAWGGPKMEAAGAKIIERTGDDAVMGLPGWKKIREHQRMNGRIDDWVRERKASGIPITVHVPTDSPAANFPICKITKRYHAKVVHLVAPQIWAWGRWRIHKLRRLTDLVLCLLPFEKAFFERREVPARFIGHMLFDRAFDAGALADLDARAAAFPQGRPRIAIMPGSRPDELRRHFPVLLDAFRELRKRYPSCSGVVAATREPVAVNLRRVASERGGWPEGLAIAVKDTDAVVRWCDLALVKSGTVTMQVAKQVRPMVIFYKKSNPLFFLLARSVLATKMFSLPNVIAGKRIVPELVPHWGGPKRIVEEAIRVIDHPEHAESQRAAIREMLGKFDGMAAASLAADAILEIAGLDKSPEAHASQRPPSSRSTSPVT